MKAEKNKAAQELRALRTNYDAARESIQKINAARPVAPCTCGRTDGTHPTKCPAYNRWKQQQTRARQAQAKTTNEEGQEA
jgi:hypothetical protein